MSNKDKLCLVVGANGFIGSHTVDQLVEQGFKVRAFDHFRSDIQFNRSPDIEVVKGDFFSQEDAGKALKDVDYFFHMLSVTTPFSSDSDPYSDIEKNLIHNVKWFEKASALNIKKIIFLSSGGAVYGPVAESKTVTEDDAPNPISPYGINKLAAEQYLAYFKRNYGLEYIIYRLTNPYGPRQPVNNNQGVISIFLDKIQKRQELLVYGDGEATRDYIYVEDAVRMITGSFQAPNDYPAYNIGSGNQVSLNEIIRGLEKVLNTKAKVRYSEMPETFLKNTKISHQRFMDEFNIRPKFSFEDGLASLKPATRN